MGGQAKAHRCCLPDRGLRAVLGTLMHPRMYVQRTVRRLPQMTSIVRQAVLQVVLRKSSDSDETAQPGSKRQMTSEEVENEEIDQFLDEGDRLANRPNSAPVGSSPTRKKKFFPKRVPKKGKQCCDAIEEARRKKELMEAEELARMQSLKKTWLRAIQDEPSELGIDKYAYKKKRRWLCLAICQGIICTHSAPRRHICFGLTIIMLLFLW